MTDDQASAYFLFIPDRQYHWQALLPASSDIDYGRFGYLQFSLRRAHIRIYRRHRRCRFTVSRQIGNVERKKNREAKVNVPPVWFPVCNQMTSFRRKLNCCLHPYFFSNNFANSNASMEIAFHRRFTAWSLIQSIHQIEWDTWAT